MKATPRDLQVPTPSSDRLASFSRLGAASSPGGYRQFGLPEDEGRAALVYLHSTDERQRKVADALDDLARAEVRTARQRGTDRSASGADLARRAETGNG